MILQHCIVHPCCEQYHSTLHNTDDSFEGKFTGDIAGRFFFLNKHILFLNKQMLLVVFLFFLFIFVFF